MTARLWTSLALAGLLVAAQGCVVPRSKYNKLDEENKRLTQIVSESESALSASQDSFRKQLEDCGRERDLYKGQVGASKAEVDKMQKELAAAQKTSKQFDDEIRAIGVGTVRNGRLVLEASLLFPLGSATLTPQGERALDKVAAAFKSKHAVIQIDGHTDNTPIVKAASRKAFADNMGLSADRALAVYRHLAAKGIPARTMYVRAFGENWPVASNATAAAKANNRRVEILFIPEAIVPRK